MQTYGGRLEENHDRSMLALKCNFDKGIITISENTNTVIIYSMQGGVIPSRFCLAFNYAILIIKHFGWLFVILSKGSQMHDRFMPVWCISETQSIH